ncbi:MAG: aminotransferase class I/II-fold pyridoxal phosphate-dependent enzyme [Pyrinomonadaceae bacterium]|nr:aminotransferase class I/II-fold pyridoxal phosphate-dependent enzyme [Pyrinomonadaceae bacterium]
MNSEEDSTAATRSLSTIAVHGGKRTHEQPFGSVVAPVFHSTIYGFESFAEMRRYARGELKESYFYSRYANPTVAEAERKLAALEGAESAVVTSSGSAATFCALAALCEAGDEVIACETIYGGTTRIIEEVLGRFNISSRFISIEDIPNLPEIARERTRAFWFETPTNPTNRLVDLAQAAEAARVANVFSITDNTFATPVLQRPLGHGINAVMHSATKYLGGHSDVTAGAVAGTSEYIARVRRIAVLTGATLDPAAAYLLARGMKTLEVRVRASCENAMRFAQALRGHEKVSRVYYPGLEDDPGHALARRQMSGFGGVVAVDLVGGEAEAERFLDALKLVRCAPSLGGVETLVSYPLYSSHNGFSDEQLRAAGVSAATVRFALGIEAADDIIADVKQALNSIDFKNSEHRTQDKNNDVLSSES